MPIHDWTKVNAGTFHDLHVAWIAEIRRSLNGGLLPDGYYAQAEQVAGNTIPDVLTLQEPDHSGADEFGSAPESSGGTAIATAPPKIAVTDTLKIRPSLAAPQRRISIRHTTGDRVVALLEIVSPGNKERTAAIEQFVDKALVAFGEGLHLQIIDLFPPGKLDPQGLHGLIWPRLEGSQYAPPPGKPLTVFAYNAGTLACYVESTAVGTALVDMPLFLTPQRFVNVPLEQTYMAAYEGVPKRWKTVIEAGR
jgi:hypothetical protein